MGIYTERHELLRVVLLFSRGLDEQLMARLTASLRSRNIQILQQTPVESISFEKTTELFRKCPRIADAIIGFGGGKALDVAKYIGFLSRLPYLSVPTSLSNDGFCSPQSSLTFGEKRHPLLPDVPTFKESGYEGFDGLTWYGIVGPANMPEAITRKLNEEINKILATQELHDAFTTQGLTVMPMTPAQFGKYIANEVVHWTAVARASKIEAD